MMKKKVLINLEKEERGNGWARERGPTFVR